MQDLVALDVAKELHPKHILHEPVRELPKHSEAIRIAAFRHLVVQAILPFMSEAARAAVRLTGASAWHPGLSHTPDLGAAARGNGDAALRDLHRFASSQALPLSSALHQPSDALSDAPRHG
jgi:hypothetical protein